MHKPNKLKLSLKDKLKIAKAVIKTTVIPKSKKERLASKKSMKDWEDEQKRINDEFYKKGGSTKSKMKMGTAIKRKKK